MNYEKLNNNQVRFLLNKQDLESRNLNLSDLSYGSQPVKELFEEMSNIAYKEFNFDVTNSPVTVDAVPISDDELEIIISKDSDPEELDTRFSKFTPSEEELDEAISSKNTVPSAKDVLDLLSSFNDTLSSIAGKNKTEKPKDSSALQTNTFSKKNTYLNKIFTFDNIDTLIDLSKTILEKYSGNSSVYRKDDLFYLIINNKELDDANFNQVCNIICEFGNATNLTTASVANIKEHYEVLIKNMAIVELAHI